LVEAFSSAAVNADSVRTPASRTSIGLACCAASAAGVRPQNRTAPPSRRIGKGQKRSAA